MKPESFLPPEVVAALEAGRTIEAIKLLRKLRGLGLAEANSAVQQYLARRNAAHSDPAPSSAGAPPTGGALPAQVIEALYRGNKIEAIRLMRELCGLGLREAKEAVEAWEAMRVGTGQELVPGEQKRSSGFFWLVLLAVLLAFAVYWIIK